MRTHFITRLVFVLVCLFMARVASFAQTSPAHIGLVYPLSSNGKNAAAYTNHFSLHVIAGVSKAETGVAVSGISNIIKENATGVQVASFSNHIGSTQKSATIAGFMNKVRKRGEGAQIAGFLNMDESFRGCQVAGFGNMVSQHVEGAQLAGFLNIARSNDKLQLAGFGNMVEKSAGVQVAGFMNKATDAGTQVGGFINIAKKVKGAQVAGFINIADSSEYPIGIINIIKGGEKQVSVSIDETATMIAAFKSGGRALYGIIGFGYNLKNSDFSPLYAAKAGIGWHLQLLPQFRINAEATSTMLTDFKTADYHRQTLGIFPAWRFAHRMEVYAGPTFNYLQTKGGLGEDLRKNYIWTRNADHDRFRAGYIGGEAGVAFSF